MSCREEGYNEYGDWIGYLDWDIGDEVELDGKRGKLVGHCNDGSDVTVKWSDGTREFIDGGNEKFGRLRWV